MGLLGFREKTRHVETEALKIEIDTIVKNYKELEVKYNKEKAEKEKVRIIREKIDITQDIKKLEELVSQLYNVRRDTIKRSSTILELKEYLETEFK